MSRTQADALLEIELEAAVDVEEVDAAVTAWLWRKANPMEQQNEDYQERRA